MLCAFCRSKPLRRFLFFFRYWKLKCLQLLDQQNNREILFVVDPRGGVGKTFLGKYLTLIHGAARFDNGKSADIKYLYKGEKIVIFDLCKPQSDHINYEVIEQIKNGILCSYKYQSERKEYKIPKIVVFMNEWPDENKLMGDRYTFLQPEDWPDADDPREEGEK